MKRYNIWMTFIKYLILWMIGGSVYYGIEILYRGYSHPSMFVVGGICFLLIGSINEIFPWYMYIEMQLFIGDLMVLVVEFISGLIVNVWLGWNVWDYSNLPCNLMGQICLPFAIMWIPIVLLAIVVDDWIKWSFLGEGQPRYYSYIEWKLGYDDCKIVPFKEKKPGLSKS